MPESRLWCRSLRNLPPFPGQSTTFKRTKSLNATGAVYKTFKSPVSGRALASGSMSHTFYTMRELEYHEMSDPSHIRTPEARAADMERLDWFHVGDHASVISTMDEYYQYNPEGRFGHYLMMVGAIGNRNCRAKGRLFSDYENAMGTSQVHVWFDKPADGWTAKP